MCEPYSELIQAQKPKHDIEMLIRQMDLTINSPRFAGRLSQYVRNWEQLTEDWWVLQAVSGYKLELAQTPWQAKPAPKIQCSIEERTKILMEIKELLAKGAIMEATLSAKSFVSQIFRKRGQRPVINLKCLNSYVKTEHFKMEGLHILPHLIQQNDWMIKMDLKDAYFQIPIHQESQHLLQLQWEDKIYQLQCLPFWLTSAPRVFSKVMKSVVGILRHMGICLVIYLDDLLILH